MCNGLGPPHTSQEHLHEVSWILIGKWQQVNLGVWHLTSLFSKVQHITHMLFISWEYSQILLSQEWRGFHACQGYDRGHSKLIAEILSKFYISQFLSKLVDTVVMHHFLDCICFEALLLLNVLYVSLIMCYFVLWIHECCEQLESNGCMLMSGVCECYHVDQCKLANCVA